MFLKRSLILVMLIPFVCSGCATVRHPVPPELVTRALVDNMAEIRTIIGTTDTIMQENLLESIKEESAEDFPFGPGGIKTYSVLAISGGGADGAYGAGLLKGWSEEGSRPVFKIITGVSTGAIIAPFAFLGKEYDAELERIYTTMSTKDVLTYRDPFAAFFGNSLASNKPLERLIKSLISDKVIKEIALQHKLGRRLFVGTAGLDAQRFVVWDMGAIAARGDAKLFRKVILASSAIPVIFPPSLFHVKADGKSYDEIHADGGTLTQFFATYKLLDNMQEAAKALGVDTSKIKSKLYIIRNGRVTPDYKKVEDSLSSLAERSINTIIDAQGAGDAYRVYVFTKKTGSDYNLAYIPSDFKDESKEMFDPKAMKQLFDRGYKDAAGGYKWHKAPPGLETGQEDVGD